MFRRGCRLAAAAAATVLLLAGCAGTSDEPEDHAGHDSTTRGQRAATQGHGGDPAPVAAKPLRAGETFADLEMPEPYTPSAPTGVGTDDYRCFLLDPELAEDAFLTGIDVLPGNPDVVHHVILFQVPPDEVANAQADRRRPPRARAGPASAARASADGASRWTRRPGSAPGPPAAEAPCTAAASASRSRPARQVVMQVHYNLLAGREPDTSAARLRLAPGDAKLTPLETVLLPAPVELPCRPGRTGALCDRDAAMADVKARFGEGPGSQGDLLHLLCGADDIGPVQTCDRPGAAGDDDPRRRRPHAPARPRDQDRGQRPHGPRHPGLGLRRPEAAAR